MSIIDDIRDRGLKLVEERLGITTIDNDEYARIQEQLGDYSALANEAEELAYRSLDYFSGQPHELRYESRRNLAQRSRVAFMKDPLAGTEAEHYANFSLGKGVQKPRAADDEVQKVLDEAWEDPNNQEKLLSYEALRAISNELRAGTNLFVLSFVRNGRVKISFQDADRIQNVVTDPEDELRPTYYVAHVRPREWDFVNDRVKIPVAGEVSKVTYYEHWQNVELINADRKANGEKGLDAPPADKLGKGKMLHVRTNRLLFQQFGTPYWSRTLRFMQALNKMMEARVSMALAASSFIAKRVMAGGPTDVIKSAESVIRQTGEIGATRHAPLDPQGRQPAPPPASFWNENNAHRLEPLQLNSGASSAEVDARLVRSSATAPSGFGPHYFSDPGNSNLATASALELPSLMAVGAWQELIQSVLRWFCDLVIQEAVRAGRLGGAVRPDEDKNPKALQELILTEAEDKQTAETRTGKDLSYELTMPYPGRRDLAAVTTAFTSVMTQLSPIGENEELTKIMLQFLFTHGLELEDPVESADLVNKQQRKLLQDQAQLQAEQAKAMQDQAAAQAAAGNGGASAPPGSQPSAPSSSPSNDQTAAAGKSQYGERKNGSAGVTEEAATLTPETQSLVDGLLLKISQAVSTGIKDPAVVAAAKLNGHGGSADAR